MNLTKKKFSLSGIKLKILGSLCLLGAMLAGSVVLMRLYANPSAPQQYPVMEAIADKLIQKYQTSTCEQLWKEKAQKQGKPQPENVQKAVELLRNDPQMRVAFINKIAAPIANKMFECGMIP